MSGDTQLPTTGTFSGLTEQGFINTALAALAVDHQGAGAPTTTSTGLASIAGLRWHDTATNTLKVRNQADTAWILVGTFDETTGVFIPSAGRSGSIAQVVSTETGAVATGTTAIPFDDTIPQSTEGDQYMSLSITPTNASSKLEISINAFVSSSVVDGVSASLFQDSGVNALAAGHIRAVDTEGYEIGFTHITTAGGTSATTFKVRIGTNTGSGTLTFNGTGSARRFGGVFASSIIIKEILP